MKPNLMDFSIRAGSYNTMMMFREMLVFLGDLDTCKKTLQTNLELNLKISEEEKEHILETFQIYLDEYASSVVEFIPSVGSEEYITPVTYDEKIYHATRCAEKMESMPKVEGAPRFQKDELTIDGNANLLIMEFRECLERNAKVSMEYLTQFNVPDAIKQRSLSRSNYNMEDCHYVLDKKLNLLVDLPYPTRCTEKDSKKPMPNPLYDFRRASFYDTKMLFRESILLIFHLDNTRRILLRNLANDEKMREDAKSLLIENVDKFINAYKKFAFSSIASVGPRFPELRDPKTTEEEDEFAIKILEIMDEYEEVPEVPRFIKSGWEKLVEEGNIYKLIRVYRDTLDRYEIDALKFFARFDVDYAIKASKLYCIESNSQVHRSGINRHLHLLADLIPISTKGIDCDWSKLVLGKLKQAYDYESRVHYRESFLFIIDLENAKRTFLTKLGKGVRRETKLQQIAITEEFIENYTIFVFDSFPNIPSEFKILKKPKNQQERMAFARNFVEFTKVMGKDYIEKKRRDTLVTKGEFWKIIRAFVDHLNTVDENPLDCFDDIDADDNLKAHFALRIQRNAHAHKISIRSETHALLDIIPSTDDIDFKFVSTGTQIPIVEDIYGHFIGAHIFTSMQFVLDLERTKNVAIENISKNPKFGSEEAKELGLRLSKFAQSYTSFVFEDRLMQHPSQFSHQNRLVYAADVLRKHRQFEAVGNNYPAMEFIGTTVVSRREDLKLRRHLAIETGDMFKLVQQHIELVTEARNLTITDIWNFKTSENPAKYIKHVIYNIHGQLDVIAELYPLLLDFPVTKIIENDSAKVEAQPKAQPKAGKAVLQKSSTSNTPSLTIVFTPEELERGYMESSRGNGRYICPLSMALILKNPVTPIAPIIESPEPTLPEPTLPEPTLPTEQPSIPTPSANLLDKTQMYADPINRAQYASEPNPTKKPKKQKKDKIPKMPKDEEMPLTSNHRYPCLDCEKHAYKIWAEKQKGPNARKNQVFAFDYFLDGIRVVYTLQGERVERRRRYPSGAAPSSNIPSTSNH